MKERKFNPMYLVMNQVQKGKVPATSKVWAKPLSDRCQQPLASWAAKEGLLPEDFSEWEILDPVRMQCVAEVAAGAGTLRWDFKRWDIPGVAHEAAHFDNLPMSFDRWDITIGDGWTVAHEAVTYGYLGDDFTQWHLVDGKGVTVAHQAAEFGALPSDFENWDWADENGTTVAHRAAINDYLSRDFDQWALADKNGWTVAHEAAKAGCRRDEIPEEFWQLRSNDGVTVEDMFCEYDEWIKECAAEYVERGKIQENS